MNARAFEPLKLNFDIYPDVQGYVNKKLTGEQKNRLKNLYLLIAGFESSLGLEILASVDFLRSKDRNITDGELFKKIEAWNDRKKNLIKKEYISIAIEHLENYSRQSLIV
jgi:hypothetical protein